MHEPNKIDFVELPITSIAALNESKRFFANAFGWSYQDWGNDYADVTNSGLGTGFNADPEHRPAKPLVIIFSSSLEASREKVLAAGGKITRDIFAFPGGRRFHFKEPGGNELAVWSDQ